MDRIRLGGKLGWRLGASLWLALLALVVAGGLARAQTPTPPGPPTPEATPGPAAPIPHTLVGKENCLACHAEGIGGSPIVPSDHAGYSDDRCQACHPPGVAPAETPAGPTLPPGALPTPLSHPAGDGADTCYDCHSSLGDKHTEITEQWTASIHGQVGVSCADCHGGDPRTDEMIASMAPEAGFIGKPARYVVPRICGGCHSDVERMRQYNLPTDQYAKYVESVHGAKLKENDTRVATCVDCHGTHDVKKASDPTADVYPLNVPALCARCHSDAALMEPYGIPTDQFDEYKASVHGEALLTRQDVRAANCASCHGSHAAKPPDTAEVANVCGKCHSATEDYFNQSLHSRIGTDGPRCGTCHGNHDVSKPDESLFFHAQPQEKHCGSCHLDSQTFRFTVDKSLFAPPEDRRCDACHHEGSMIMAQVQALHTALADADQAYRQAEEAIRRAAAVGMIVTEAESNLAEARTSLISARATLHTTKLPVVTKLTDAAKASADAAHALASQRLDENLFRRRAMAVAVGAIVIIVATLSAVKYELDRPLKKSAAATDGARRSKGRAQG